MRCRFARHVPVSLITGNRGSGTRTETTAGRHRMDMVSLRRGRRVPVGDQGRWSSRRSTDDHLPLIDDGLAGGAARSSRTATTGHEVRPQQARACGGTARLCSRQTRAARGCVGRSSGPAELHRARHGRLTDRVADSVPWPKSTRAACPCCSVRLVGGRCSPRCCCTEARHPGPRASASGGGAGCATWSPVPGRGRRRALSSAARGGRWWLRRQARLASAMITSGASGMIRRPMARGLTAAPRRSAA